MALFGDLSKWAKDLAGSAQATAKDAAETMKINVAISNEQKEIEKNYHTIGEWFVNEYEGEIPEAVKELVDAVAASKAKIEELEASRPVKEVAPEPEFAEESVEEAEKIIHEKICPICGNASDSKFCPRCGAPMGE